MMNIQKNVNNGSAAFSLEGRLDTITAPELEGSLKEILPELTELTLDFAGLDYISSAGLRVLLSAQKVMNRQGSMKIVHVNQDIQDIFDVTGFSDILTVEA